MSLQLSASRPRQLQYSAAGLRRDLRLLEVDEALLSEIACDSVVIKGGHGDDAVLCTVDKTFALKYVETTNALLLVPPDAGGDEAFGGMRSLTPPADASGQRDVGLQTQLQKAATAECAPPLVATATAVAHIEAVRCLPRLGQLRELLASCRPYGLEDEQADDMDVDAQGVSGGSGSGGGGWRDRLPAARGSGGGGGLAMGFTTQQLLELVQASRAELLLELSALRAVSLGGRWRLVEPAYLGGLLEVLLLSATENGWALDAMPVEEACRVLAADGYRPVLVRHCLQVYGAVAGASQDGAAAASPCALDRGRVCLHFARKLLAQGPPGGAGGAGWPRSRLMAAWGAAVPEEWAPPDAGLLAGEALEELPEGAPQGSEPLLVPFAERDLPLEPAVRFAVLFKRRPRWERSAMEPYLAALASSAGGQTVEALLLRHARASQPSPDAPLMFSAR